MKQECSVCLVLALLMAATPAWAHPGRRFQIEVVNGQLQARGVNLLNATNGMGVVIDPIGLRPYYNAQHGHWEATDAFGDPQVPQDDLPGYDIGLGGDALTGFSVSWTLTDAWKWTGVSSNFVSNPSAVPLEMVLPGGLLNMPVFLDPGFVPVQESLGSDEIEVLLDGQSVSTDDLGQSLTLIASYDGAASLDQNGFSQGVSNGIDIDLEYGLVEGDFTDTLYVLESVLSTDAPGVADSATIYTIFAPDGSGPAERLHFASLSLEEALGTPIPEPGLVSATLLGGVLMLRRRYRRA
ncbi:MAG: hypothetical protein AAF750_05870 [Planctomycetota bacterium]